MKKDPASKLRKVMNPSLGTTQTKQLGNWLVKAVLLVLILSATACGQQRQTESRSQPNSAAAADSQKRLVLESATINQPNQQGQTQWKINAKRAVYSPDQKTAQLEDITGNLYQDGKVVLQVEAKRGTVKKDGKEIVLRDQFVATDPRNGATIRGENVVWRPQQDLLLVRQNFTGSHPKLTASANQGKYDTSKQRLELIGQVEATAQDPSLHMKTEHLFWKIQQGLVISDRTTHIDRYKGETITDSAVADHAQVNLNTQIAQLNQNVELKSLDPLLQIATESATWNPEAQTVVSDKPVRIVNSEEKVTATANQGQVNLDTKVAHLTGGVQGISKRNQAQLFANKLFWKIPSPRMQAKGNVIYRQADPPLNTTGTQAKGNLANENIVVRGGDSDERVVTEIVP